MDTSASNERLFHDAINDFEGFYKHLAKLKPSQRRFVTLLKDWTRNPRNMVVVMSGRPGSGKTFTVVETLKYMKFVTLCMASTARIAHRLNGKTIHSSLNLAWGKGTVLHDIQVELENEMDPQVCLEKSEPLLLEMRCYEKPNVVVIDEGGQIPHWLLRAIIEFLFTKIYGQKLVIIMGDKNQLTPVRSVYNIFGVIDLFKSLYEMYCIELTESMRFVQDYHAVIECLRDFVDHQDEDGMFEYLLETFPVVETVDSALLAKCTKVMAHKNETVENYNKFYVKHLPGERVRLYRLDLQTHRLDRQRFVDVKPNCNIFLTENRCSKPEKTNGTPLVFLRYDPNRDVVVCKDDSTQHTVVVERNNRGMFPVALGFAGTVHKFQGDTIDDNGILFNFDGCRDLNLVYTALSRVRSMDQVLAVVL